MFTGFVILLVGGFYVGWLACVMFDLVALCCWVWLGVCGCVGSEFGFGAFCTFGFAGLADWLWV